jgi:hypothetical protein
VAAKESVVRKSISVVLLVLVAALTAPVAAQVRYYPTKVVSGDSGVFRWVIANKGITAKGGINIPVLNMTNTIPGASIPQWSLVGWDSTPLVVVTRFLLGDTVDQRVTAIPDSLRYGGLDTLPRSGASTTQYDTAKIASFYLRVRIRVTDMISTNDTCGVIVRGLDQGGVSQRVTFKIKGTGTLDTVLTQLFSHVDSVWATGRNAGDSFAMWAYPNGPAVTTGTGFATASGPESYAGITQYPILNRTRGVISWEGPSKVRVDGTTSTVQPGYWLLPATVLGKCSTAQDKPLTAIGKVWDYDHTDGVVDAVLHYDGGGNFSADSSDSTGIHRADSIASLAESLATAAQASADSANDAAAIADSIAQAAEDKADSALAYPAVDSGYVDSVAQIYAPTVWQTSFRAGQFTIPTVGGPALMQNDSSNFSWFGLAFDDDTTEEYAYILNAMEGYTGSDTPDSVGVMIYWLTDSAATDTVRWLVDFINRGDGQLFDTTLGLGGYMGDVNEGAGKLNVVSGVFTATSFNPDDLISLGIGRETTLTGNIAGDVELVLVRLTYYRGGGGGGN